ncbi:hypothetical protein [Zunongwangia sp.]|uniref:hypothetical protein n=1 Tax=Zunongwangia sp. TaxID=1965325 RepID=UPI003AA9CB38
MRDWIIEYARQTEKLAPLLYSHNLQQLANTIYQFQYDHIQYTADGALQQLSSPACTWRKRKTGVDCKSYAIFASSLLTNLGINHAIRQVRQPHFNPENWTHVYVVIFQDQKQKNYSEDAPTFVIDATRHHNQEVNYLEKSDLMMLQHVGLNAPSVLSAEKQNIIDNFNQFCQFLLEQKVPVTTVNAIRQEVHKYTSQGIDPQFAIITNGISIQGKPFTFRLVEDRAYQQGLGVVVTATASLTAGKALMKMLPSDFFGSTFGAIFANGFDLSCWNASYSESKAQADLSIDLPYLMNEYSGLGDGVSTAKLNKFLNAIEAYISNAKHGQQSKYASCTRKGYAAVEKAATEARDKVLATIKQAGLSLIPTGTQQGFLETKMPSFEGRTWNWGDDANEQFTYKTYRVEGNETSTPNYDDIVTTNPGNSQGGGSNQGGNNQNEGNQGGGGQVPVGSGGGNAKQAGMGWVAALALAGVAVPMLMKNNLITPSKSKK